MCSGGEHISEGSTLPATPACDFRSPQLTAILSTQKGWVSSLVTITLSPVYTCDFWCDFEWRFSMRFQVGRRLSQRFWCDFVKSLLISGLMMRLRALAQLVRKEVGSGANLKIALLSFVCPSLKSSQVRKYFNTYAAKLVVLQAKLLFIKNGYAVFNYAFERLSAAFAGCCKLNLQRLQWWRLWSQAKNEFKNVYRQPVRNSCCFFVTVPSDCCDLISGGR